MYSFVPLCFLNEHLCTLSEFIVFFFVCLFVCDSSSVAMNEMTSFAYKSLWYNQNKPPTRRPFMLDVTKEVVWLQNDKHKPRTSANTSLSFSIFKGIQGVFINFVTRGL